MSESTCCTRPLIDNCYIGQGYVDCEARGGHDWLYDGQTCCSDDPRVWHQTCHCNAGRWVGPPAFIPPYTRADRDRDLATLASIRELSAQARALAVTPAILYE